MSIELTKNNNKPELIILIGMMGAGKTTIGRALARELKMDFLDLDHEIVRRCGVAIPTIFDIEGEEGFRRRETSVLAEVVEQKHLVLATGGGAVMREENRALLQKGRIIYLKADIDELFARVSKDTNRPLLQTENPKEKLRQLLELRAPIYSQLADVTVETGSGAIVMTVRKLKDALKVKEEKV